MKNEDKFDERFFEIATARLLDVGVFKGRANAEKAARDLTAILVALEYADNQRDLEREYMGERVALSRGVALAYSGGLMFRNGTPSPLWAEGAAFDVVGARGELLEVTPVVSAGLPVVYEVTPDLVYLPADLAEHEHRGRDHDRPTAPVVDHMTLSGQPVHITLAPNHEATTHVAGDLAVTTVRPVVVTRPVELPAVLFDTHAVWRRANATRVQHDVSPEHVAAVLDAVVAMMRGDHGTESVPERNRREGTAS